MRRTLTAILLFALAALPAGCGGSKQLRTLRTQNYLNSVPLGTAIGDVTRDLGSAAAKSVHNIGQRKIELLFYRTSVNASKLGVVYSSGYTPLFFEAGRLIAVGWELRKPEFARGDTEKVLTQIEAGRSAGKMFK